MPNSEALSEAIQQSLVTAIAFIDDEKAEAISKLIDLELLDEPYNAIASECLNFRKKYKRPPGKGHIDDVFADIIENPQHKQQQQYIQTLRQMLGQSNQIDTNFLLDHLSVFMQLRRCRKGIEKTAQIYNRQGPNVLEELDEMWRSCLRIRDLNGRHYGFSLGDDAALGFLDRDPMDSCSLGIRELDEHGVIPTKRELLIFLAARNKGKSQFLNHCGKHALLKGWRVLHYTLENSDDMTSQRYFQSLFNGVKREGDYSYTSLSAEDGHPYSRKLKPDFVLERPDKAEKFLAAKQKEWRSKLNNVRIRRFPSGRLSFADYERDMDELALVHHFEPDLVLLDMPQLMKLSRRRERHEELNDLLVDLRGSAVERNYALVAPQQGNREAESAQEVRSQHGGGTIESFGVADNAITYSQTPAEEEYGLARLFAGKVRNDSARFTVLISQHYASGQFCMSSKYMTKELREDIKAYTKGKTDDESDDDQHHK